LIAVEAQPGVGELSSETGIARPDPLTLTLRTDATHVRDITKDPMLEEFAASLTNSWFAAGAFVERLVAPPVAP
jgi:hypothetical protein